MRDDGIYQILRLFDTATDGLKEVQFYAMLRLIAHAQNGRRVTPELVHLGGKLAGSYDLTPPISKKHMFTRDLHHA
jgi:hypothetical protein